MNIIENNPYRILGVFVNSPTKERVANQTKLKTFLKVGKAAVFLLDLPQVLPSIVRSQEMVAEAEAKLALPADQLKNALFWFVKNTPLDEIAFKHLYAGDMEGAMDIWSKKADLYSLQNRLVCALIKKNYGDAIRDAELLYSHFSNAFVEAVVGTNSLIDANELAFQFLDVLCNEIPTDKVLPLIKNETWRLHVSSTVTKPTIGALLCAVDKAHAVRGKGAQKRYEAGKKLMQEAKPLLIKLGQLLAPENLQYQMVADKVGLEVLQCGIDYFNDSEDADAARNAMILQEFALQTVVGKMAKGRCKENVDTLKKIGPEHIVLKELTGLSQLVKKLDVTNKGIGTYNSIKEAFSIVKQFIEESNSHLISIKEKLGRENKLYISTSSVIATSAVNAIVTILNREQLIVRNDKYKLRTLILSAAKLMYMVGNFDMDNRTNEYYSRNKDALVEMDNATDPNLVSEGCYIATMAYCDYNHPQVLVLREFRDLYLDKRGWGKQFIKIYYKYSPRLVEKLKDYTLINKIIRKSLDCFIFCIKNKNTKE